ncbi:MAG TPA: tRNA (cytidine(34)-2'-O)-methyltransferase [Gemmatimonadales bacterium]|nr:tRNA (cytidine(34)-2'-O)-methyltransferase [Gemmatimonadales bacterium]
MLHIALLEPQIPPNTGNIARLCAATDTALHLVEPLGFSLDDKHLKRAGLDYWDKVDLWRHPDWFEFRKAISRERCIYFSAHATRSYLEAPYQKNSVLVFGREDTGLPARIIEKHPEQCFKIPMPGDVRSLNLATAAGIVLYEALRQVGRGNEVPEGGMDADAGAAGAEAPAAVPGRGRTRRGGRGRSRTA